MIETKLFSYFKKATFFVAFFISFQAQAANKETYKDIIDKAYNLSLQKDRSQAVSLLLGTLKKETKKAGQKELVQALEQISQVFISDKAQQQYELGFSLKWSDPQAALNKLIEASRLEPENASIDMAIVQQQMMLGDCDGAASRSSKYRELANYLETWKLILSQTSLCEGKFEEYLSSKTNADLKGPLAIYWLSLEIEYQFKSSQWQKAKEAAGNLTKIDPDFPESYYWHWKLSQATKVRADKEAQRYVSLCKTMKSRQQRAYSSEPFLCRRTTEVETFLKNNNNAEL